MTSSVHQTRLPGPIQAIAWNRDCTSIAVSHVSNDVSQASHDVIIYETTFTSAGHLSWSKVAVLKGHDQLVSALDWAPRADQILSCSYDRNAFVWTRPNPKPSNTTPTVATQATSTSATSPQKPPLGAGSAAIRAPASPAPPEFASTSGGAGLNGARGPGAAAALVPWEKQMVITRLTKGALCVRWSPSETKFSIGSAAKVVSVGYYDKESNWWACKMIRKAHESSVVCVSWHPNSLLLATGSTDTKVRLFNAHVEGCDPAPREGALPPNSAFGDCLIEVNHEGCLWVHSVAWSPGDEALMYSSHDAVVGYVRGPQAQVAVRLSSPAELPLKCLVVVSERVAVGAGWDGFLVVLTRDSVQETWRQAGVLGESQSGAAAAAAGDSGNGGGGGGTAGVNSVVRQLAQMHVNGAGGGGAGTAMSRSAAGGVTQFICHTALVTGLHVRPKEAAGLGGDAAWHVASAGLDGQVILWDLSSYL